MKKLVVVGGGYGGLNIVANILHSTFPEDIEITMIDRNPYHALKTEFYATAAGTKADVDVRLQFPKDKRVKYVFGEVTKIDTENEQILLEGDQPEIPYDTLVVALGCEDAYHGVPGAKEYGKSVQTIQQARETALAVGNTPGGGIIGIVGGGLSGIETAAEIRESRPDLRIRLFDRNESVLRPFHDKVRNYVEEWFAKNEVEVIHHCQIEEVTPEGIINKGKLIPTNVTIWTAGVQPSAVVRDLPYEKDKYDKIIVNEYYQVPEATNVYVVGDCAASEFSPSGQLARQQGQQIAEILLAIMNGKEPRKPKPIKLKGTLGSLGKNEGFGNMMEKPMTGWLPRLAKTGVLWINKRH
ncbi:FAD-dependent oxidoreductase [Aciduricibacillus chroicocephali]|uniref:FAD-dependent oxidoreductase n=1 Tax=Aciduricibacillus chroicocephali TaxID=3054939 RepID=A0ABY9KUA6_9BACI|nr:FAD-dependent oxidoreductase [Bacillaceae bacterium 44XB]